MPRSWLAVALVAALVAPVRAQSIVSATAAQTQLCHTAVAAAERASRIPPQLLVAISRVESGRRDPLSGEVHPWPWAVNAEGQGHFYDTKAEAIAAVRAMQARGVRSIDVGCGQINLMHHPNAFPSLEVAFEPAANAAYAARFLRELFTQTGDWDKAAARYHSATPDIGDEYQQKVLAVWPAERRLAGSAPTPLAQAWGATLASPPPAFTRVLRSHEPYRVTPIGLAYQPPARRTDG
jgi:hypothetical protein